MSLTDLKHANEMLYLGSFVIFPGSVSLFMSPICVNTKINSFYYYFSIMLIFFHLVL